MPCLQSRAAASAHLRGQAAHPDIVYAVTKRDHEEHCLVVGAAYGIPTVALRFFNVYGPGQALSNPYTGVAAIFASRLLNSNAAVIFEDGRQSRDFIHVSDIVEGILLALELRRRRRHADQPGHRTAVHGGRGRRSAARGLGVEIEPKRPRAVPCRRHPALLR